MRAALSGLTTRGRSLLAGGVVCVLSALVIGDRDLLRIGVFVAALPLVSAATVSRTRYRLSCSRRLSPARVPAGQPATVSLQLANLSRLPTGVLLVEDRIPYTVGERPRFVLDRLESQGQGKVTYPVRSEVRGRFRIGPLSVRLTDPFGLCELTRSFSAQETLVVTPQTWSLPAVRLSGDRAGGGDERNRSVAAHGEDDVATREYRHGDPLRRVHWRSTARTGQLMVRREEQPWRRSATVLLDSRAAAHGGDGPAASLEWAVSAAASVALHLGRTGYAVRVVTDSGVDLRCGADVDGRGEPQLLDTLAIVEPSGNRSVDSGLRAVRRAGLDGLVVTVLGALSRPDLDAVARLATGGVHGVAVLLDPSTWVRGPRRPEGGTLSALEAARLLRVAGWRVLEAPYGTDLSTAWSYVGADAAAPAPRRPAGEAEAVS